MSVDAVADRLGARIRSARLASGESVRSFARRLELSPSLLSQIELGRVRPSVATLYAVVRELGISLDEVFAEAGAPVSDEPPRHVRRAADRERIELDTGIHWERLTAAHDPQVDFVHVTYEPGARSTDDPGLLTHAGREYGYVLEGRLGVQIGFDTYELDPGDAVSFPSATPHRSWAVGDEPAVAVWVNVGNR